MVSFGKNSKKVGTWKLAATRAGRVAEAFYHRGRRSAKTQRTYRGTMVALANFMVGYGENDGNDGNNEGAEKRIARAIERILRMKPGTASATVLQYDNAMRAAGLSSATIRLRLSAVSSLIKSAAKIGEIDWTIEVDLPAVRPYRDCAGPSRDGVMAMIAAASAGVWPQKGARDAAALWLMFGIGLRKGELLALTMGDVDLRRSRLAVVAKGAAGEKIQLDMPGEVLDATAEWISMRGLHDGPLMTSLWPGAAIDSPLSESGLAAVVGRIGGAAGLGWVTPHGLRHAAITEAANRCGGDILAVRDFARHGDVNTTIRYLDRLRIRRAEIAEMVASGQTKTLSGPVCEEK
jgi:integrase